MEKHVLSKQKTLRRNKLELEPWEVLGDSRHQIVKQAHDYVYVELGGKAVQPDIL